MLKTIALFYIFISIPCHAQKKIDYEYNHNLYKNDDYLEPIIVGAFMTCTLPLLCFLPPSPRIEEPMNKLEFLTFATIFLTIFDLYCYYVYQQNLQYWDQFYQTKNLQSLIISSSLIQNFIFDLNHYTKNSNAEQILQNGILLKDIEPLLLQAIINQLDCDCVCLSWKYFLGSCKKEFNYIVEENWKSQNRVHRFFERIRHNNIKKNRSCLIIITDFDSLNDEPIVKSFESQNVHLQIEQLVKHQINNIIIQMINEMTLNNTQSNQNFILVAGLVFSNVTNIHNNFKLYNKFSTII